ncbi:hypothetical protein [Burkholderia sp. AU45388]|uniref:hypothetical protein n=1 Tax=Burkholderia sp. AU45388 TaxID=3059206 RepID=UPI0026532E4B|nr:hypothetical protein [Burkholderia sp. AU45388]MDN7430194.1 hypothetical protein [Burkholderia sp. AU45388]
MQGDRREKEGIGGRSAGGLRRLVDDDAGAGAAAVGALAQRAELPHADSNDSAATPAAIMIMLQKRRRSGPPWWRAGAA